MVSGTGLSLLTVWRRMPAALRVACVSIGALLVVVVALLTGGADDWSRAFAILWYGTFLLAVVSGVIGLLMGIWSKRLRRRERILAFALSLPAPATAVWFIYALSQLADLMD